MATQKRSKQSDLIDIIDTFLRTLQEPIHYKELTMILVDAAIWTPYGKSPPDQIVYSAMHQDIRKRQEWSAFRLVGPGVFCTSETKGVEQIKVDVPPVAPPKERLVRRRSGDTEKDVERRLELLQSDATCGNCTMLEFCGIEEYKMSIGTCGAFPKSGRMVARINGDPCQCHVRMTKEAIEARLRVKEEKRQLLVKNGFLSPSFEDVQRARRKG